ncbi:MAG: hypothetical protein ACFFCW_06500 [Candidatus Hodarchaeota archaeon]
MKKILLILIIISFLIFNNSLIHAQGYFSFWQSLNFSAQYNQPWKFQLYTPGYFSSFIPISYYGQQWGVQSNISGNFGSFNFIPQSLSSRVRLSSESSSSFMPNSPAITSFGSIPNNFSYAPSINGLGYLPMGNPPLGASVYYPPQYQEPYYSTLPFPTSDPTYLPQPHPYAETDQPFSEGKEYKNMAVPARAQTIFFDDFTGSEGASLNGRVPPGGGGTWAVEFGSAVISDNRARILDQAGPPPYEFPECAEAEPPPHCFDFSPLSGRIRLILDTPVTTSHRLQITVVDYFPGAENVDIRAEETPSGLGVWRVAFDRAVGIIVPQIGTPSFIVILPLSKMQPGTYAVTVRDVDFSTQTFAVDVSATFSSGGGVSATAADLYFDGFPLFTVGAVAAVMVDAFEETPTDDVLIDDVRLALALT